MTEAQAFASQLRAAYADGAIPPLRSRAVRTDAEAAYAIQSLNSRHWIAAGRRPVGHKIGLTSPAVQRQLGVDQPDYGRLFADMQLPDGGVVAPGRLLQPRIEAEIAFVMGAAAGHAHQSETAFLAAVDRLYPALEIVDSRIADWKISLFDTIADNASSGLFVLGGDGTPPAGFDFSGCAMRLLADGEPVSAGVGCDCLGSPVNAGLWLARTLAGHGQPLRPGDILLSGALGPMVGVVPGTRYQATIEGLGDVAISFA